MRAQARCHIINRLKITFHIELVFISFLNKNKFHFRMFIRTLFTGNTFFGVMLPICVYEFNKKKKDDL